MKRLLLRALPALAATLLSLPALAGPAVVVEPVRAEASKNWLYELRKSRGKAGAIREDDARRIADDMGRSFQAALEGALRDEGFEVLGSASAGALRLSARLDDVFVSAPENTAPGVASFTRATGRATLHVQARDAAGAVLMQVEQRSEAGDLGRLRRASDVSNRFWFDALFRGWSGEVAKQLKQKAR